MRRLVLPARSRFAPAASCLPARNTSVASIRKGGPLALFADDRLPRRARRGGPAQAPPINYAGCSFQIRVREVSRPTDERLAPFTSGRRLEPDVRVFRSGSRSPGGRATATRSLCAIFVERKVRTEARTSSSPSGFLLLRCSRYPPCYFIRPATLAFV